MIKIVIITKHYDTSLRRVIVQQYNCMDTAYEMYELLKRTHDNVELGVEINDNYLWLLKWGEHDLQNQI